MCVGNSSLLTGCHQMYSDMSQTSLQAGSIVFYPLHVTFLSLTKELKRPHIVIVRTVTVYLLVRFGS